MDDVAYETPSHHDAEALLAFFSDLQSELPHLHVYPDDELASVDRLEGYIRRMNEASNSHILVARRHNRIIGCVTVEGGGDTAGAETGELGITVFRDFRNHGVGTRLIKEMISWAHGNDRLERIILHVETSNSRAIHVYRSLGFIAEDCGSLGTDISTPAMVCMTLRV